MSYSIHGFRLTPGQKKSLLASAVKGQGHVLRLKKDQLAGPDEIMVTKVQKGQIQRKRMKGGAVLKLSKSQLAKSLSNGLFTPKPNYSSNILEGVGMRNGYYEPAGSNLFGAKDSSGAGFMTKPDMRPTHDSFDGYYEEPGSNLFGGVESSEAYSGKGLEGGFLSALTGALEILKPVQQAVALSPQDEARVKSGRSKGSFGADFVDGFRWGFSKPLDAIGSIFGGSGLKGGMAEKVLAKAGSPREKGIALGAMLADVEHSSPDDLEGGFLPLGLIPLLFASKAIGGGMNGSGVRLL